MESRESHIRITRIGTSAAPGGAVGAGLPMLLRLALVAVFLALFVGVLIIALPLAVGVFLVVTGIVLVRRGWGMLTGKADRLARRVGVERADREGRMNVRVVEPRE